LGATILFSLHAVDASSKSINTSYMFIFVEERVCILISIVVYYLQPYFHAIFISFLNLKLKLISGLINHHVN